MMEATAQSRISIKLFFGFESTALFRQHIYNNPQWEQALIMWQSEPEGLRKILHDGADYIGLFLNNDEVTLDILKEHKEAICKEIAEICPELKADNLKFQVFPQIFIS